MTGCVFPVHGGRCERTTGLVEYEWLTGRPKLCSYHRNYVRNADIILIEVLLSMANEIRSLRDHIDELALHIPTYKGP